MGISQKPSPVEVRIDAFSKKGNGLGLVSKLDGSQMQVEVPFTMPGDVVNVTLLRKNANSTKAKLEEIVSSSPDRILPRCAHFSECGGCRFQHVPYEMQLSQKKSLVYNCFAELLDSQSVFHPIIESPQPWLYRNKSDFSFSNDSAENKYLGLIKESSKGKVFNISECHLTSPWFVTVVQAVKKWWDDIDLTAYQLYKDTGTLRSLTIREGQRTGDRMVILTVSGHPDFEVPTHHLENFVTAVRNAIDDISPSSYMSIYLRIQTVGSGMATSIYDRCLYGHEFIREELLLNLENEPQTTIPITFQIGPSTFFHHNVFQAESLYSMAYKHAQIPAGSIIYQLYSGTGTLGFYFARDAQEIISIELSPESAEQARQNAKLNGFQNIRVVAGAVRHVLSDQFHQKLPSPQAILISPPRPGIDPKSLINISKLSADKIVYVSSNPFSQAHDVADFLKNGYRIQSVQPADHFPMTAHVENVVILNRT